MNKLYAISILCSSIIFNSKLLSNDANDFFKEMRDLDREWDELFERRMQKMNKMRESFFDGFFKKESKSDIKFKHIGEILTKETGNSIEITIPLPDMNVKRGDIELKAKGKNLEGSFTYNDHKVNFMVKNGLLFTTWVTYKHENKEEKDKSQYYEISESSSSTTQRLPREVANLENATAFYVKEELKSDSKDVKTKEIYKLKIVLPKFETKADWKKIEVKEAAKEISEVK